jgi:hypothetical protein
VDSPDKFLIDIDLTQTWDWKVNLSERARPKTNHVDGSPSPPSLIRGSLFQGPAEDPRIYLLGGTTSPSNDSFAWYTPPTPSTYSLWSYDTETTEWAPHSIESAAPLRPNNGAYAEAPDLGLGFWFGGQLNSDSGTETTALHNQTMPLDGMLIVDLNNQTATNVSTTQVTHGVPRTGAGLQYVSGIGSHGVLAMFGGLSPQGDSLTVLWDNDYILQSLSTVYVFDVGAYLADPAKGGVWYEQKTGGASPPPRTDFCLVTVSAPDNSSHNIYMYGGWNPLTGEIIDDVYVLSLPSFTWTLLFRSDVARFGHTCHLAGGRQMVTVGGTLSTDFEGCDWEIKGVAVFDLSESVSDKQWGSVFYHDKPPYQVPEKLVRQIGGE